MTYLLFVLVSAFSLVMGFYDLYKNVPYLDKARTAPLDCFVSVRVTQAGFVTYLADWSFRCCWFFLHCCTLLTRAAVWML